MNPCLDSSDDDNSLGGKDKKRRINKDGIKNLKDILSDPEELTSDKSDIDDISADEDDVNVPIGSEKDEKRKPKKVTGDEDKCEKDKKDLNESFDEKPSPPSKSTKTRSSKRKHKSKKEKEHMKKKRGDNIDKVDTDSDEV